MSERRLTIAAVVAVVVGIGLMIPFEHPLTLALGIVFMLAFIVLGVFGLLTPERLLDDATPQRAIDGSGETRA